MAEWTRMGKTMVAEGPKLSKTGGGNYPRHCAHGAAMEAGVHTWEIEFTSAATANSNRQMYVGVGREGLDVEKGNHHKADAWYLRIDDATLFGVGAQREDQTYVSTELMKRGFQVGDRIGVKMNCDDGSLSFYKNGEKLDVEFPAGTITGPVVGAVELVCVGQTLTLLPEAKLA